VGTTGAKNGLTIRQQMKAGVRVGAARANTSGMKSGDVTNSVIPRYWKRDDLKFKMI